jgi:hypothetical protein
LVNPVPGLDVLEVGQHVHDGVHDRAAAAEGGGRHFSRIGEQGFEMREKLDI